MRRLLLHVCCGPCATHSIQDLQEELYDVTLFFSNSNIQPETEYYKRLNSLKVYVDRIKIPLIIDSYNPDEWFELIRGYEANPEGGARCQICIKTRLEKTAQYAKFHGFEGFTTTLTISPHKNFQLINELGEKLGKEYNIQFLPKNFKKKDGFQKSIAMSKEHQLYRQNYCGCRFSMKKQNG
jgi:predicted adenine nucleotide alpha hydrolase (AANH) superfamily ATPase